MLVLYSILCPMVVVLISVFNFWDGLNDLESGLLLINFNRKMSLSNYTMGRE